MHTVRCKALVAFTHFAAGHGQVHGDPGNKHAATIDVPEAAVDQLVRDGRVEVVAAEPAAKPKKGKAAAEPAGDDEAPAE